MEDQAPTGGSRSAVTAQEVADLAGVSRAAVSRTFTPGASVSPAMRKRVIEAADELGYQVNHLARGLIRARSGIVALIAAEVDTPYRSRLVSALTDRLQASGKVAMIINTDRSDNSVQNALRKAIGYRVEAAVILSGMPDPSLADLCVKNRLRLVLINRSEHRQGSVRIRLDDEAAGRKAFEMLIRAGCKRPALATSLAGTPSLAAREKGFIAAAGTKVIQAAVGSTSYETGLSLGTKLFTMTELPDGVFCTTDLIACGLIDAARHRFGLRVPEDVSVIGFDNIPQAGWDAYKLTTFAQPIEAIADACIDWLSSPAEEATEIRKEAPLVWRASVRRPEAK